MTSGTVNMDVASSMDMFVTILELAGVPVPSDRPIDGSFVTDVLVT